MKTWDNLTLTEMLALAAPIWRMLPAQGVVCFYGEMGAGKTTFINALAKAAGVEEETSSPTFSIVNEYRTSSGQKLYHFDCYRINDETEAMDFGIEDYFYDKALCFVEWPERVFSLIPAEKVEIHLHVNDDETRNIRLISLT